jgi:ribosomal protein S25
MNLQQKAIIDQANKEGVLPCERDARLIVYSMVDATRKAMSKYEVSLNKMTQIQQDAVYADLEEDYKETALTIARILASGSTPSVPFTLKDMKIANGTVTGLVNGAEKHFNELISKVQDKSEVLIVLYPRDYADAMDGIQGEKDQRDLPIDDEPAAKPAKGAKADKAPRVSSPTSAAALAKKATELPPKLLQDARDFITNQQVCTVSGIQNGLKIGAVKATAVLDQMAEEGLVKFVGDSKSGEYQLVRESKPDAKELTFDGDDKEAAVSNESITELPDDLYAQIKAKVIATNKVSIGALSIAFDIDDEITEQAVERLELDGVVSEENEMGTRSVIEAE